MKPKFTLRSFLALASSSLLAISYSHATTYTWDNSNVTGAATLDWFTGGPNTLGLWTGVVVPVSSNLNTIQFFADTTTNLTHAGNPTNQTVNINNGGSAFQLGTLTLSGRASATNNAKLNLTISGDALNFSAATGTINLDALNVDADQLITYNVNSNIQLGTASSGSVLTIQGNGTSTFNIGGIISELQTGGGSLIKSGTSSVSLNGVNSYTGDTTVSGGTLAISGTGSLGNGNYAGNISIASNAVLNFGNDVSQTLSGDIANNGTLAFSGSGGVGTYLVSGDISGSGSVNYNASIANANGTLTLSGNNTYTGKTSFGPGNISSTITLSVSSFDYITSGSYANHGLGSSLGAPTTIADGTILIGALNNGNKTASATLRYTGSGETTDRVLSFAFSQVNAQRTIDASGSGLLKFTSPFTYTSGPSANNFPAITLSGTGLGEMAAGITNLYTAGGLGLPVTKSGAGTWTLSGSNSYTGATTITQGTLQVSDLATPGSSSSVGASTGVGGLVLNGGTLRYSGGSASTTRNFALTASSTIDASGTGALNFSPAVVSPDQNLSANFATGQKVVTGLSSTADLVVGMRVLGAGVNSTIASIDSSSQITLAGNTSALGTGVSLGFGYTATARTLTLTGTNTDANTIAGILQDTSAAGAGVLSLAKSGVGTWVLGGANTYTGSTTLNAGTLKLNYDTGAGGTNSSKLSNTITIGTLLLNGGTLELSGGTHLETVVSTTLNTGGTFITQPTGGSTLSMGVITYTGGALYFAEAGIANVSTSAVQNGILASTAGIARVTVGGADWAAKDGSNNVIAYTGYSPSYTGATMAANINYSLTASGVSTMAGPNFGATTNTLKIANTATGSLAVAGNTLTLGAILFAGSANYEISTTGSGKIIPTLLHNYGTSNATLTLGALGGTLTQFGTGKTILNNAATTNGTLNINGGIVQIGNNLQIGTNTGVVAITLNNGTLLASETLALNNGGLNSRTITLGAGGGTLAAASTKTLTVSGVISGVGNPLTIGSATNTGTVTLTNTNTYTGPTTVSGGTLLINGSNSASSGAGVASGAALGGDGTVGGNATFDNGSIFAWNLSVTTPANTGSATVADTFAVTGNLVDGGTAGGSVFKIVLAGTQTFADTFWTANHTWNSVLTSANNSLALATLFTSFSYENASGTIAGPTGGSSFSLSGSTLNYTFSAIPEPTSALAGLLLTAGLLRRRRQGYDGQGRRRR